ncbi:GNAT family N-acetyltransferase [Mesobaculum littorinae]|uniref:GNAT family N-acetyltransferase n=1 Tax=Mesobaculum littorinae TaxID=2486419 RepID=UPI001F3A37BD|nr:GNAT family N-acetyltransferase [Mesobaculum littorinae]
MSEPRITREDSDTRGRWVLQVDGQEAELTYSRLSPARIIADHTGVPSALEGRGLGRALVARMVEDARAEGLTVVPTCPFVRAMGQRHADWQDVIEL